MANPKDSSHTLFGHPVGLFTLFFAEMWERFSYYGMRALLVFYCMQGFLEQSESQAKSVYGAYTALVYMTPFFGGLLADRILGARLAVVVGGILMAAGHLLMTFEHTLAFYVALALLIAGNGFFKPNISAIVGSLYGEGNPKRDGGFTIFYMGINLGATMSPLLCGYIGTTYGWHYGFGLATIGMMAGLAVFVMPTQLTQALIMGTAALASAGLLFFHPSDAITTGIHVAAAIALLSAGVLAFIALSRGGLPDEVGRAPKDVSSDRKLITIGVSLCAIPLFALLVSGFSIINQGQPVNVISPETLERLTASPEGASAFSKSLREVASVFLHEISKPAGLVLGVTGVLSFGYLTIEAFRLDKIPRQRMYVVLILTFFNMLFWAFFEQAGSSLNLFADQNVDRTFEERTIAQSDVGQTIEIEPTQEQVGYKLRDEYFTLERLQELRKQAQEDKTSVEPIPWPITEEHVGMGVAKQGFEIPAATFQSVNPGCILLFGLVFAGLWSFLGARGMEPSTTVKFALGLIQLGLGFGILVLGAKSANARGMVGMHWLVFCYMIHTTGELCLSPVGLSMVTKLTPARLVSTMMGGWFLATAFSQYLAGIISQFTGGEGGEAGGLPVARLPVYAGVFEKVFIAAVACGVFCLALAPILTRWMHIGADTNSEQPPAS